MEVTESERRITLVGEPSSRLGVPKAGVSRAGKGEFSESGVAMLEGGGGERGEASEAKGVGAAGRPAAS